MSQTGLADLPLDQLTNPVTGEPGARVRFLDEAGEELFAEDRLKTAPLVWFGGAAPISESASVELTTRYTPADSGNVRIGFAMVGRGRVWVDGELVIDEDLVAVGDDLGAAFLTPPSATTPITLVAGTPIDLRFEIELGAHEDFLAGALSFQFGTEPDAEDHDALIAEAAEAAAKADVALVVVGTNSMVESEGFDRDTLALPGRQDDLVSAVAAANPRTVVLVNAGSPVLMPWRDEVAAVLVGYFGGQEFGDAVADVLLGVVEPGGRLPTTWGATDEDVPVLSTTPVDGALAYTEGIHIGYRAWLKHDAAPAYWFGHGLGYTDIAVTDVSAPALGDQRRGRHRHRLAREPRRARRQAGRPGVRRARGVGGRPPGPLARRLRARAGGGGGARHRRRRGRRPGCSPTGPTAGPTSRAPTRCGSAPASSTCPSTPPWS